MRELFNGKHIEDKCDLSPLDYRGHKTYLETSPHYDFESYRSVVNETTQQFSKLSLELLTIISTFKKEGRSVAASLLEEIQEHEKEKLNKVCRLHVWYTDPCPTFMHSVRLYLADMNMHAPLRIMLYTLQIQFSNYKLL